MWLIYPIVRQFVSKLALAGGVLQLWLLACMALAFACPPGCHEAVSASIWLSGCIARFLFCLSAVWCHETLLAHRGSGVTRFIGWFAAILSLEALACCAYSLVCHAPLLVRQAELPLWASALLLSNIFFNLPNMAAAPLKWRVLLVLYPLPDLFLWAVSGSLRASLLLGMPLRIAGIVAGALLFFRLSRLAPLIISMPPKK